MADPADSTDCATPRHSRVPGSAPSKRRASAASSVSVDTENKLARAVQSAQRLAQLSDVPRDDSTLDLFPDDPTRALVESMTIDVRQGTLSGFELPPIVQAAVEAAHGASPAAAPPAPKRAARPKGTTAGAQDDAATAGGAQAGAETPRTDGRDDASADIGRAGERTAADGADGGDGADGVATRGAAAVEGDGRAAEEGAAAPMVGVVGIAGRDGPVVEAATLVDGRERAAAERAASIKDRDETVVDAAVPAAEGGGASAPVAGVAGPGVGQADARAAAAAGVDAPMSPGRAAAIARAAGASVGRRTTPAATDAAASASSRRDAESVLRTGDAAPAAAFRPNGAALAARTGDGASVSVSASAALAGDAASASQAANRPAMPAARAARMAAASSPELDRARATAFADTVDALYGVIADQRRAAADLTRRMKWMLAIVAGALLVTVGVGVTQTLLLSRLARDAAAQQQRTEQVLQTQQAALAGALERLAAPASASAPGGAVAPPATVHPVPTVPAPRHVSHGRRAHSAAR